MRTILALAVLLVVAAALFLAAGRVPFGEPRASAMDDYFIARGQEQTAANNIVTSVVFDYRGFDTLGEATVLFTAVLGVSLMFRKRLPDEEYEND